MQVLLTVFGPLSIGYVVCVWRVCAYGGVIDIFHAGHDAGIHKLRDLRAAWLKFTRPAVSAAAKTILQQVSACLHVPYSALDLDALQNIVNTCTVKQTVSSAIPTTCPVVTLKAIATASKVTTTEAHLKQLNISEPELRALLPKKLHQKKQDAAVIKAQGLALSLIHI